MSAAAAVELDVWEEAVAQFADAQTARGRAASTLGKQRKHLARLAATFSQPDPWQATTADLAAWLDAQAWEARTRTAYRSTLRSFYSWAVEAGHMTDNPALTLSAVNTGGALAARPLGSSGPLPLTVPTEWARPIAEWSREARAQGHSRETIALRDRHLRRLARAMAPLGPWEVTFGDLIDWTAAQEWSVETRRSIRTTLRVFYAWALEAGHITTSPAARLPKTGVGRPNPYPASEEAVHLAVVSAPPRERLMIRLAAEIGLRRAEVARVHSRDLIRGDTGWSLIVHGKGSKDRLVPIPDALAAELRTLPEGWAFPSPTAGGHLSPAYVGKIVTRWLPEGVSMHALRHRFATGTYRLNQDVFAVQQLLGHASPETTRRYVAVSDDTLRGTVNALAALTTRAVRPATSTEGTR